MQSENIFFEFKVNVNECLKYVQDLKYVYSFVPYENLFFIIIKIIYNRVEVKKMNIADVTEFFIGSYLERYVYFMDYGFLSKVIPHSISTPSTK